MLRLLGVLTWITVLALASFIASIVVIALVDGNGHPLFIAPIIGAIGFLIYNLREIRRLAGK